MKFEPSRSFARVLIVCLGMLSAPLLDVRVQVWAAELEVHDAVRRPLPTGTIRGAGFVTSVDVVKRPLKDVLSYLSRVSGYNIIPSTDQVGELEVTIRLENIYWRDALDVIATKYRLVVDDTRIKARVLMVDKPEVVEYRALDADIREVISTIAEIGKANVIISPKVQGNVTMKLENIPWRDALEIVAKTNGFVLVQEPCGVTRVADPTELELQLETRVYRLSYVQPTGTTYTAKIETEYAEKEQVAGRAARDTGSIRDVLDKVKSKAGTVAYNKRGNALIITDTASKLEVMERIIRELDVPPKQVHISLKLVEMSDTDAEKLGMLWANGITAAATGMKFGSMFPFPGGPYSGNVLRGSFPGTAGVGAVTGGRLVELGSTRGQHSWSTEMTGDFALGTLDFTGLNATLNFLRTQTRARLVQSPQLIVLDHEESTIHVGRLVRYAEWKVETTSGGGVASGFTEHTPPVKLGIQVLIIPHVTGPDNNVMLTVIPKTESPAGAELFEVFMGGQAELKLPQTVQRVIVTKLMLHNGETGVLGGLREEQSGETIQKIPFLGDIPILGWFFKHRDRPADTNKITNLMIFITPTVIDFEKRNELEEAMAFSRAQLGEVFTAYEPERAETGAAGAAAARTRER